jgi:hypothetical protein
MVPIYPKQLVGVWLDHKHARIIDARSTGSKKIQSRFESRIRETGQTPDGVQLGNYRSSNNEASEHHQEQHDTMAYFKNIAKAILPYDEIFLFGPTTAKDELQHFLLRDNHFHDKIIRVEASDYLTDNQQVARVRLHFKSKLHV